METKNLSDDNLAAVKKVKSVSPASEGCLNFMERRFSEPSLKFTRSKKKKKSILKTGSLFSRQMEKSQSPDSDSPKPQQGGVTWDTKAIDEQINYRKLHPIHDKKKLKSETDTKFKPVENIEDSYSKAFNNVIKMKVTDEILKKVIDVLNEPKTENMYRTRSSKSPFNTNYKELEEIYSLTEKDKVFGNDLEKENIRTLQNTMLNKFHKEISYNKEMINQK